MVVKMKIWQVLSLEKSLAKVLNQADPNPKITYRRMKILKAVSKELTDITEARQKIVNKYREFLVENEKKEKVLPPEQDVEYKKEMNEFLETETELDIWQVKLSDLTGVPLNASDMAQLEPILEVPTEEEV